jgi:hypothetical protein
MEHLSDFGYHPNLGLDEVERILRIVQQNSESSDCLAETTKYTNLILFLEKRIEHLNNRQENA